MSVTVTVEAAFGHGILDASPTWTDISEYFRRLNTGRGRSSMDGRFETGTAAVVLDNRDGRFNPDNTAGSYSPNVKVGVPIRIRATWDAVTYDLFYGTVRGWPIDYPQGSVESTVTVPIVDPFYNLNLEDLDGNSYSEQTTDERIDAVLDDIGWPAALRDLDSGVGAVQAVTFDGEQSAFAHLQDVAEAEAGVLFMAPDGKVTFHNRTRMSGGPSSEATFDGTEYSEIEVSYDDDYFWNVARVTREGGETQEAVSDSFDSDDGRRVLSRDNAQMDSDPAALNVAEWLVAIFGEVRLRVDRLAFKPLRNSGALMPEMLGRELRDMVTVQQDPPGGDSLNQDCIIERIEHRVAPEDWSTVLQVAPLSDLEQVQFWILGTSDDLGTDTILA